jgi:hypothetical protein
LIQTNLYDIINEEMMQAQYSADGKSNLNVAIIKEESTINLNVKTVLVPWGQEEACLTMLIDNTEYMQG